MKTHLIAAALALFAAQPALAQQPEVFDTHVHIWKGAESVEAYLAQVRADGREVTRIGGMVMAERGIAKTRQQNDDLIALAKRYPKLVPIASVHPYDGRAAMDELDRIAALGVRAIKLHPHTQKFDSADPRVLDLCRHAGKLGITIFMDNANIIPGDSENLFNLAVAANKTNFVFTHMGALNFRFWNVIPLARTTKDFFFDNINFEISATVLIAADSPIEEEFVWTMRNIGFDRIILGSDYPQMSLDATLKALDKLGLTEEEKAKIRYGNAARLILGEKR